MATHSSSCSDHHGSLVHLQTFGYRLSKMSSEIDAHKSILQIVLSRAHDDLQPIPKEDSAEILTTLGKYIRNQAEYRAPEVLPIFVFTWRSIY